MTTKYTDEQIIEYLRTLREGDVLTAVSDSRYLAEGKRYVVTADSDGDLRITDRDGDPDYVRIGVGYDFDVAERIRDGVFEIPTQAAESSYVSIRQIAEIESGGTTYKSVSVRVDDAGFAELEALEVRSFTSRKLAGLYAQRAEIQAEIDAITKSLEAL